MPRTMPRSTAQITGCSLAAVPKGQCSATIAQLAAVVLGVGGEPVGGEGVGDGVQGGAERALPSPGAIARGQAARPYSMPTSSAIASASAGRHQRQRPPEQRDQQVVAAHGELEARGGVAGPGSASTGARRRPAAGRQLTSR